MFNSGCVLLVFVLFLMKFFVLSWNVRDLGRGDKRLMVKDVVRLSKAEVVLLQETKVRRMDKGMLHQVCLFVMVGGVCLLSKGASGGYFGIFGMQV